MNNISFQDYYPKYFLKDKKYYESLNKPTCFCGRVTDDFIRKELINDKNFIDAKKYLICEYELNLIGQILHAHFPREYYVAWQKHNVGYEHKSCTYGTPATGVLLGIENAEHMGVRSVSRMDILEADKFFLDWLFNILKKEKVIERDKNKQEFLEELQDKIKNDSNVKFIFQLLNRLKN